VLLVETDRGWLTGWHRWYSFIYRLGFRPAFLITSQISEFDDLVKTLLSEADRAGAHDGNWTADRVAGRRKFTVVPPVTQSRCPFLRNARPSVTMRRLQLPSLAMS
jgi:hypothetical protein